MNLEKISILFERTHLVRLSLGLILMNFLIYGVFVIPGRNKIAALQAEYAGLRSDVMNSRQEIHNLQTRLVGLQQAQKDLKMVYSQVLVPKKTGMIDIRLELESLLRDVRVSRHDFSFRNERLPEFHLREFRFGLPVEGTYHNIRRFINNIERSRYFLILDRVDLSSERSGEILNLDFSLSTYLVEDETSGRK